MSFLPILERELRVASRKSGTYLLRLLAAAGFLGLTCALLLATSKLPINQRSSTIFVAFGILALLGCLLAGTFLTADCLSEEKREGTLGLLFLTDLRGYDIVAGKLAATSLNALYSLFAIFPILALPLLMGGITMEQFWRVILSFLGALGLSLAIGMFVSSMAFEARQAVIGTFLGVFFVAGFIPGIWWLLASVFGINLKENFILNSTPVLVFENAFDVYYHRGSSHHVFWTGLELSALLAVSLLLAASFILASQWRETRSPAPPQPVRDPKVRNASSAPEPGPVALIPRSPSSIALLNQNPSLWLASRDLRLGRLAWGAMIVLSVVWLLFMLGSLDSGSKRSRPEECFTGAFFTAYVMHVLFKYVAAVEATRQFSEGRRSGSLELLLVSPLSEQELMRSQVRSLSLRFKLLFVPPVFANLAMASAAIIYHEELHADGKAQLAFLEVFLGGLWMLWADYRALPWVGMARGLLTKTHNRAIAATLGRLVGIPLLAVFLMIFLMIGTSASEVEFMMLMGCWFFAGAVNAAFHARMARRQLRAGLRELLF